MSTTTWVYVALAVGALVALAVFWRQIVRAVLLLAGLGVGGLAAWAFAQQATATRQTAVAATVAATGSAAGNVAAALLAGALLAVLVGGGGYLWLLQRRMRGPAAQHAPQATPLALDDPMQMVNALVRLEMLRMLRDLRAGDQPRLAMPVDALDDVTDGTAMPVWW